MHIVPCYSLSMQQTPHDALGDIIYGTLFVLGLLVATIGLIYATAWPCALCIQ